MHVILMFTGYFNEHFCLKIKGSDPLLVIHTICLYKTLMNVMQTQREFYITVLSVTGWMITHRNRQETQHSTAGT